MRLSSWSGPTGSKGQVRQLSGQIEQLQFQNTQLEEQLQKFQQDVEYRFQELKGSAARPNSGATPATAAPGQRPATLPPAPQPAPQKRSDAFDPAAQPDAPGAPRTLGNLPGDPSASALGLPPGLPQSGLPQQAWRQACPAARWMTAHSTKTARAARWTSRPSTAAPADCRPPGLPPQGFRPSRPRRARVLHGDGHRPIGCRWRERASRATITTSPTASCCSGSTIRPRWRFRQFLQSHPRDQLVPDATYWLGETYFRRGRYPDAVEQYLKIYKTFGNSRLAPESMLKLSLSLRGMGQPEQACATLAEISRKYPDASADVRASVDREAQAR